MSRCARMIHGRPHPYTGDRYAQLYAHFRPVAGWVGNPNVRHWGQPGAQQHVEPSRVQATVEHGALDEEIEDSVPITVTNERNAEVDLYWQGELVAQLGAGESVLQTSYAGHVFVAKTVDRGEEVGRFVAGEASHFVIESAARGDSHPEELR